MLAVAKHKRPAPIYEETRTLLVASDLEYLISTALGLRWRRL